MGMKRISLVTSFMLIVAGCALREYSSWESQGRRWIDRGNYAKATEVLTRALESDPSAEAYLLRGIAYEKQGEYSSSLKDFNTALKSQESFEGYYNRGIAYKRLGNFPKAVNDFGKAIALSPKNSSGYFEKSVCQLIMQSPEEAQKTLAEALEIIPENVNLIVAYARTLYCLEQYREGIQYLQAHMPSSRDPLPLKAELAWFLAVSPEIKMRDYEEAIRLSKEVLVHLSTPVAFESLAAGYAGQGKFADAVSAVSEAIHLTDALPTDVLSQKYKEQLIAQKERFEQNQVSPNTVEAYWRPLVIKSLRK